MRDGERYRSIMFMRGGMYWQQYAHGFGWGMTIRSARTSHILVRATKPASRRAVALAFEASVIWHCGELTSC